MVVCWDIFPGPSVWPGPLRAWRKRRKLGLLKAAVSVAGGSSPVCLAPPGFQGCAWEGRGRYFLSF